MLSLTAAAEAKSRYAQSIQKYKFRVPVPSQTTVHCKQGGAKLRILSVKTKWSEFQMPSQYSASEVKQSHLYSILEPQGKSSRGPATAAGKAKPNYVYSILKPRGQSSKSPPTPLPHEVKPS